MRSVFLLLLGLLLPLPALAIPDPTPLAQWAAFAAQDRSVVLMSPDRMALAAVKGHPLLEGQAIEARVGSLDPTVDTVDPTACGLWFAVRGDRWGVRVKGSCPTAATAGVADQVTSVENLGTTSRLFVPQPPTTAPPVPPRVPVRRAPVDSDMVTQGVVGGLGGLALTGLGVGAVALAADDIVYGGPGVLLVIPGAAAIAVGPSLGHYVMGDAVGGTVWIPVRLGLAGLGLAVDDPAGPIVGYAIGTVATFVDIPLSAKRRAPPLRQVSLHVVPGTATPLLVTGTF